MLYINKGWVFFTVSAIFVVSLFLLFSGRGLPAVINSRPSETLPSISVSGSRTPEPEISVKASPSVKPADLFLLEVPFTAQAPFGEWSDPRQQDGCEEASSIMAVRWAKGLGNLTLKQYKEEILSISEYEEKQFGSFHDTSAKDTVARIIQGYFKYSDVRIEEGINSTDIIEEIKNGNVVIVPADGRKLNNPNFTRPGPERHMLVVIGHDGDKNEFITNDPGTRNGKGFRYAEEILMEAVGDYETGYHEPLGIREKVMIVVSK